MPEVRAALLIAAEAHLARRPWSAVRMGEVAASAGVSRQTLYNEFGSKEGLARALARQAADGYLAGIERALARPATDPRERLRAAADWTVAAARPGTLLRSLLTGCWGDPLPAPRPARATATAPAAQRRAELPLPGPGDLLAAARDRAVAALDESARPRTDPRELARECECVLRLALSRIVAPPVVGGAGAGRRRGRVTGPSRRAGGR
ncbi:TetR-family transcriptional regulator [Streptomyces sp. GBA 94-10 4N24]|uniref:TetR/AcrR family transcriptional regulator n=1 Tax=Streptomyces sp. GBA 94-10 4N24 TaxID=1218177 RepID=UPI0003C32060|nr:TetR/AcrR family transcriptional regulator [Streptomyces sp. GBA 94-10 4N24]ESP99823.1 TetR-family transcriptional regulator [Streptomyces sp. GBA 94-10 4N24]UZN58778.1 TetR-family transcriptional regulator [Streptomyces sp. GBA 94-10 4N24]